MPRYTVGREVDDFVKTFLAAQRNSRESALYDQRAKYYQALAAKNSRTGSQNTWLRPLIEKALNYNPRGSAGAGAKPSSAGGEASPGGWWTPDRVKYATNFLEKNAGLSKYGAAGLVARWAGVESKDKGPASLNPDSGAWGIGQWLGKRKPGIEGNDSFDDQLKYAAQELKTSEKAAYDVLRNAKNFDEAARGASMYERAEHFDPKTGMDDFTGSTPVKHIYTSVYGEDAAVPASTPASPQEPVATPAANSALPIFAQQPSSISRSAVPSDEHAELEVPDEEQFAADGGMIEEPQGGSLEAALDGALRTIQESYGLKEKPAAIPGADQDYQQNISALNSNERAMSPEAMQALIERTGSVDNALTQIYDHFAKSGDMRAANDAAVGVLQASRQRSMELGQHAMKALQQRDFPTAAQALITAYNDVPDGQKVTGEVNEQGVGKAIVTNKGGKVVDELPLNPQSLAMFAQKFASGSDYYGHLARFAGPRQPAPQEKAQGAVPAYLPGGLVSPDAPVDDEYSSASSGLLAGDDMTETAADVEAGKLSQESEPVAQTAEYDGAQPSAVQVGSAPGIEQPPYIPLDPSLTPEERRMVDSLNRRMQWMYQQSVQDYKTQQTEKRAVENREATDRRAAAGREASQSRLEQRVEASKEVQQNAIKARREDAEAAYERTAAGKAEKEERDARRASERSKDIMGAPVANRGDLNDADMAVMRQLDLGARAAPGGSKGYTRINSEYATDEDTPNKTGSSEPYAKAVDAVLSSAKVVDNNQRADGSKGTDPYAAPLYKLSDADKEAMTGLITSIGVRNPTVPPSVLARAVLAVAYNPKTRDVGVDPRSKQFFVRGDPGKPTVMFAMSGAEYEQLIGVRRDTDMLAKAQAQIAAKKQKEDASQQQAKDAEVQKRSALRTGAAEAAKKNQSPWIESQLRRPEQVSGQSTSRGFLYDQLYGANR